MQAAFGSLSQRWDSKKSLTDNLIQREEDAHFNAQLWMTNCLGLNLETLQRMLRMEQVHVIRHKVLIEGQSQRG